MKFINLIHDRFCLLRPHLIDFPIRSSKASLPGTVGHFNDLLFLGVVMIGQAAIFLTNATDFKTVVTKLTSAWHPSLILVVGIAFTKGKNGQLIKMACQNTRLRY